MACIARKKIIRSSRARRTARRVDSGGADRNGADHALRPGVAASDAVPPFAVVPIEDLVQGQPPAAVPGGRGRGKPPAARAKEAAPAAYPHMQHMFLALRSLGASHDASRSAIVRIIKGQVGQTSCHTGRHGHAAEQGVCGPTRSTEAAPSARRRTCAPQVNGACGRRRPMRARGVRALLARRGVRNVEAIEELLEQGEFEAACASE